jgi:hypothetical protein
MKTGFQRMMVVLAVASGSCAMAREPLTTVFSYQGRLQVSGAPATGRHDLRFRLFWQASGGTQVGPEVCANNVDVVNGNFAVNLDFGNRYDGQRLFLEVMVRPDVGTGCDNATGYVTMTPRQELTMSPHAGYAMRAGTATDATTLGGQSPSYYLNAANLTGSVADARLSSNMARLNAAQTFTGALTLGNAGNQLSGIGSGLTALNASNISAGTLSAARMPTNWAAGGVLAGTYPNPSLAANAVTTAALASDIRTTLSLWNASGTDVATTSRRLHVGTGAADATADVTINSSRAAGVKVATTAASSIAVWGAGNAMSGVGVYGSSNGSGGTGVKGLATGANGYGGYFENQATSGTGLFGRASATAGSASGVRGESNAPTGAGVWGVTNAGGSTSAGVYGANMSTSASTSPGVKGESQAPGGVGVLGTVAGNGSIGVRGESGGTTAESHGVLGQSNAGDGVRGESGFGAGVRGTSMSGSGVFGESNSPAGSGVRGVTNAGGAEAAGVLGQSNSGDAVRGESGFGAGVRGVSTNGTGVNGISTNGSGIMGTASATASPAVVGLHTGGGVALFGSSAVGTGLEVSSNSGLGLRAASATGSAISASNSSSNNSTLDVRQNGSGNAIYASSRSGTAIVAVGEGNGGDYAIAARNNSPEYPTVDIRQSGSARAVYASSLAGNAVYAINSSATNSAIYAVNQGTGNAIKAISFSDYAIFGQCNISYGVAGLTGRSSSGGYPAGVHGNYEPGDGDFTQGGGVYGRAGLDSQNRVRGYGVVANGGLLVVGTGKAFGIDHPLDPANRFLFHWCAEGPEPLNVYSGTAVIGDDGTAVVRLPDYFEAINKDPRYQVTPIGSPAMLYIAEEVKDNRFVIGGGKPGMRVSWCVQGVRNDIALRVNPPQVDVEKPDELKNRYFTPHLYGFGEDRSVFQPSPKLEPVDAVRSR